MAETKTNRTEGSGSQSITPARDTSRSVTNRGTSALMANPFEMMDRMSEEMDRAFNRMIRELGWPRGSTDSGSDTQMWSPRIEAVQRGDRFIVRAELPGMKKDDVQVELTDDTLTIQGERRQEHEDDRNGMYHSEREYGQFYRSIALPEGAIGESAKATFSNGVLEVSMQAAPAEANRGRRLDISEERGT